MNGILEKFVYADKDLSLKEQADLVDKFIDMIYSMLWATFPDLHLSRSGSVLYNNSSMQVGDAVKLLLLPKKALEEEISKCSTCGREHSFDAKKWILETMISDSKQLLQKTEEAAGS